MAKRLPEIYVETGTTQIVAATGVFVVVIDGKPFNMVEFNGDGSRRYGRTTFLNEGHAHNLAERLNGLFKSAAFSVWSVDTGGRIP